MSHDDGISAERVIEVERVIDLDAPIDEVWALVCRADLWLADEGALGLGDGPGAIGRLVEGGTPATTRLDQLDVGRRIAFRWWDERGDEGDASRVEITLVPTDGPTHSWSGRPCPSALFGPRGPGRPRRRRPRGPDVARFRRELGDPSHVPGVAGGVPLRARSWSETEVDATRPGGAR